MNLLPGVRSRTVTTSRLAMHYLEAGTEDGVPVVLVHGNLSTSRFFEHILTLSPPGYRLLAPDMRGFGRSQRLRLDATRGLRDWSDDIAAFVDRLGIDRPIHLAGWSTAGAAIAHYAMDHHAPASLTFIDPVPPYGFGAVRRDGTLCWPDNAGSGAGGVNPEFVTRLREGDTTADSPFSPRNVMNSTYWNPEHRESPQREDVLVEEILLTDISEACYPGDSVPSQNWPGFAPGTTGILNALAPQYCNWSGIVDIDPKPPVLWTHGQNDVIVADGSALEMGALGAAGVVPGWPGVAAFPPQPMITQIADVLTAYQDRGGRVQTRLFPDSGHGPLFDAKDEWCEVFFAFLESVA